MPSRTAYLRAPADFGLVIQRTRMACGPSQSQLAKELGVSQSAISEIESGKSTIHMRRLLALANTIGVKFTAIWDGADADP